MEVIKKYSNRKLYSTELSKYVPLPYIIDLVKIGSKFVVIDVDSDKDVTRSVLKSAVNYISPSKDSLLEFIKNS